MAAFYGFIIKSKSLAELVLVVCGQDNCQRPQAMGGSTSFVIQYMGGRRVGFMSSPHSGAPISLTVVLVIGGTLMVFPLLRKIKPKFIIGLTWGTRCS